jgi:ribosomal-protein-alanine N-acetyltransferase
MIHDPERLAEVHATAFTRPWTVADFAELQATPGTLVLVSETHGRLDGFVMLRSLGSEAEVLTLAVRPEARRRGVGLGLIEAAVGAVAQMDALWLEVAEDNAAALSLYARAGFSETGRRRGYYTLADGGRTDALVMRRVLNTAGV